MSSDLNRGFSRREVLGYALCGPILASLGALTGSPSASAASSTLIDFTDRLVPADQVAAAGTSRSEVEDRWP